jgi:FkbM family methyltransferase
MYGRIANLVKHTAQHWCWNVLAPQICLPSGISVTLRSRSDFDVFAEIFVAGEYDRPLHDVILQSPEGSAVGILDLGANIGLFTLRACDLLVRSGAKRELVVSALEGNPNTFHVLADNIPSAERTGAKIKLTLGLAGERTGSGYIYSTAYSGANTIVARGGRRSRLPWRGAFAVQSEYVDIRTILPQNCPLDLIKCDIEGSELAFLRAYPDLLKAARRLVVEFHPQLADMSSCQNLIKEAGFELVQKSNRQTNSVLMESGRLVYPRRAAHAAGVSSGIL